MLSEHPRPVLPFLRDIAVRGSEVVNRTPTRLWSYAGYNFWRWDMALKLGAAPAVVEYAVVCSSDHFFSTVKRCEVSIRRDSIQSGVFEGAGIGDTALMWTASMRKSVTA